MIPDFTNFRQQSGVRDVKRRLCLHFYCGPSHLCNANKSIYSFVPVLIIGTSAWLKIFCSWTIWIWSPESNKFSFQFPTLETHRNLSGYFGSDLIVEWSKAVRGVKWDLRFMFRRIWIEDYKMCIADAETGALFASSGRGEWDEIRFT